MHLVPLSATKGNNALSAKDFKSKRNPTLLRTHIGCELKDETATWLCLISRKMALLSACLIFHLCFQCSLGFARLEHCAAAMQKELQLHGVTDLSGHMSSLDLDRRRWATHKLAPAPQWCFSWFQNSPTQQCPSLLCDILGFEEQLSVTKKGKVDVIFFHHGQVSVGAFRAQFSQLCFLQQCHSS